ncbi:MAG: Methionine--tRNA ligase [Firmicutes bacterium ADurb.Bin506]|jgi:methionyl-tRNA synthetase|nr:MAG: Methionine--tRNA ligase [Firmicutes bacterium ADurb.Bin506]
MKPQSFYITTPIYYVNDLPHLGHAYTTVACDAMARYKRMRGYDVYFLTGTDEHGQKIERKATAEGFTPQAYVDKVAASFADLWKLLDISNDRFIRTTDADHVAVVQKVFEQLYAKGDIYKGSYEGWYCTPDEAFFPETQLVDGKCPDCGREVEWTQEEAYFFRLSKYAQPLLEHIKAHPEFIQPVSRRNEMIKFIEGGLDDLCVSRTTFSWGVPVTFAPGHVAYVWIDALTNYITAAGYLDDPEKFARYWPADVHVMGKEIVRFHSVIWPALLMSLGLPLPGQVFGHGWWTVEGEKMSKSRGNVIKPEEYAAEFGVDAVRYFMLREVPFGQDGDFSRMNFIYRVNADLANDLGNLLSRATAMINKFTDGRVPTPQPLDEQVEADRLLPTLADEVMDRAADAFDKLAFQDGLAEVFRLVGAANKYIDDVAPWSLAKTDEGRVRLSTVLYNIAETVRVSAVLLAPVITTGCRELWRQLGLDISPLEAGWEAARWGGLEPGTEVRRGDPVYPRYDAKAEAQRRAAAQAVTAAPSASPELAPAPAAAPADVAPPSEEQITIDDFAKVDLRVATVVEAEPVKGSEKLMKIQVDLGWERRQIVAGIAKHYSPADLVGKQIVVVANLKPAKLRGEVSNGMLLAASTTGEPMVLATLTPDKPISNGSKVK